MDAARSVESCGADVLSYHDRTTLGVAEVALQRTLSELLVSPSLYLNDPAWFSRSIHF